MISDDTAVKIDGVYKNFKLPHERNSSLKSAITGIYKKRNKGYEVQHALQDISFEIKKGEFFGIVGRNGSGKSTLLKIIAEIYQPTKGVVEKSGKLVPFIELGVGFNPELTGRENVFLNGAMLGFNQQEVEAMYNDIVEFAELGRFMDQKLKNYSSGMQVRLAFSVATRAKAEILLIDEVLAVGDADFQRKCFNYFKSLKKTDVTVVFVSHDMDAVREYCDRAALINDSQIVAVDRADEIAKEYTKLFITDQGTGVEDKQSDKWGNGGADMQNVVTQKTYQEDEIIKFQYDIIPDNGFTDEIMVGLVIKDAQDRLICGTNSKIMQFKKKIVLDHKITVHWSVPNIFNEGTYKVDIALDSLDKGHLVQWWDAAATFEIVKEQKTPYLVAPSINLTVES